MVCVMIAHLDLISYWSRSRVDVASSWWGCAEASSVRVCLLAERFLNTENHLQLKPCL